MEEILDPYFHNALEESSCAVITFDRINTALLPQASIRSEKQVLQNESSVNNCHGGAASDD